MTCVAETAALTLAASQHRALKTVQRVKLSRFRIRVRCCNQSELAANGKPPHERTPKFVPAHRPLHRGGDGRRSGADRRAVPGGLPQSRPGKAFRL
ncbi:hypothetical protein MPLB_1270035 [Mesorhizobium sp. ORS 3324]|nr:hypothetical protein MPLB_1270035 [Mesorhizobium sp. ORS 3324]